jgi:hypothetical protein
MTLQQEQKPGRGGFRPGAGRPKASDAIADPARAEARHAKRVQRKVAEAAMERAIAIEVDKIKPLAVIARGYTPKAIAAYISCLDDKTAAHADKIRAATELLNRGWGKAVEHVNVTTFNSFAGLSDGDIAATLAVIRSALTVRTRSDAATDITQDTTIVDGVGGASGVQASEASPADAGEAAASSERRD